VRNLQASTTQHVQNVLISKAALVEIRLLMFIGPIFQTEDFLLQIAIVAGNVNTKTVKTR